MSVVLLWIVAGTLSMLSSRHEGFRDNMRFHLLGLVPFFGCLLPAFVLAFERGAGVGGGGMNLATVGGILAFVTPAAIGGLIAARFVGRAFTLALLGTVRWFVGDDSLVVERSYDQGEALEKQHRWEEALRFYREILVEDPEDREARRRIAEIEVRRGERGRGLREFEVLVATARESAETLVPLLRLVDLLTEGGEQDRARGMLEDFLSRCNDSELAAPVRRRLERQKGRGS